VHPLSGRAYHNIIRLTVGQASHREQEKGEALHLQGIIALRRPNSSLFITFITTSYMTFTSNNPYIITRGHTMPSHATKMTQTMLVADEAWCALALLHREQETRESFSAREILDRVKPSAPAPCFALASKPTSTCTTLPTSNPTLPGTACSTNSQRYYRLFRPTPINTPFPQGKNKTVPGGTARSIPLPPGLVRTGILHKGVSHEEEDDPILKMRGVGKEMWAPTDADEYVRDLRSNWYGDQPDTK